MVNEEASSLGSAAARYGVAVFANAIGTGFFFSFALLFYASLSGLSLDAVGRVLTGTALVVLPSLLIVGRLVDRFGPRPVLVGASAARGVAFLVFVAAPGLHLLVACALILAMASRAEQAASPVLAAQASTDSTRSRWLALSRVAFNAGMGCGALVAGGLAANGYEGYRLLGVLGGSACLIGAAFYRAVPERSHGDSFVRRRVGEVRIWRHAEFSKVALANALLWMAAFTMESALPVFVVNHLHFPTAVVGVLFAVNTTLLVFAQLPASRFIDGRRPGMAMATGGLLYVIFYAAGALASDSAAVVAMTLLCTGMVIYTIGELAVTQSALLLLTALPPREEQGSYLAQNQILVGLCTAMSPVLAIRLLDAGPVWLWAFLTIVSVVSAALVWRVRSTATAHTTKG